MNTYHLVDKIRDASDHFRCFHEEGPSCLYLGRQEWAKLSELNKNPRYAPDAGIGLRPTFEKMTIYKVDAETHVAVS